MEEDGENLNTSHSLESITAVQTPNILGVTSHHKRNWSNGYRFLYQQQKSHVLSSIHNPRMHINFLPKLAIIIARFYRPKADHRLFNVTGLQLATFFADTDFLFL